MADDPIVMDGDLIADAVANACPRILTDEAAREIAEKALLNLSAMPGVVVTRGPDSEPWPPQPKALVPAETVVVETPAEEPWQSAYVPRISQQTVSWDAPAFRWPGND